MVEGLDAPTWLVTGASGFLGANLGASLNGRAHRIGIARSPSDPAHFDSLVTGDLREPEAIAKVIIDARPAVIVNAAAIADHSACEADPHSAMLVNAIAPRVLAEAARSVGARFVQISTDAVFDGSRGRYRETDAPAPFSTYGRTKLAGEHAVLDDPDALVIRTNFFGWSPTGDRSILEFFVDALSHGRRVPGFTDFVVTSMYVRQLCEVIWGLCLHEATGLLHVAASDAVSKYDFGVAVAHEFGLDSSLIVPRESDIVPSRRRDLTLDVTRAAQLLGQALPTQHAGIVAAHADTELRRSLRSAVRQ